ncbi:type II toxin-antitoxin system VapC family toxin [Candidatus Thiothrix anitrata]|jgi:PIN domain nuclease of toxin-antitoxin system|uniref:Type II toxin-antitoxin system VapC family toxin n=1 Tax=Candidatus Thiothrix anitrata TaxID=2823902 RepID=A0ABX7X8S8_9GAMM|nr:type II toxin-antitoxin system VapC family toxin [Candidatus Thiothrix anitrata]QTR51640.1 type II toxin-antitoxin system VapC family toxin [Candidatus Thiothrix anitrata]
MRLLLDTCTFLWLITDDNSLSQQARDVFQDPHNEVFLSAVSLWEITVKYQLGKLPLPEHPRHYIPRKRQQHQIESLSLHEDAIQHLANLPDIHRDPFDRMLICQAIQEGMAVLTPDPLILQYPVNTIW